jgi:hypothetical protein
MFKIIEVSPVLFFSRKQVPERILTQNSVREQEELVTLMPGKKVPECRSASCPSEKGLPERCSITKIPLNMSMR